VSISKEEMPRNGIEPLTRGFSVHPEAESSYASSPLFVCIYKIYKGKSYFCILVGIGWDEVFFDGHGHSLGTSKNGRGSPPLPLFF
jgi:hypothetical protein